MSLGSKPSFIESGKYRFLIMDSPKENNLNLYIKECKKHGVTDLVRICEEYYPASEVEAAGIRMHEKCKYDDGDPPPDDVISNWTKLVDEVFHKNSKSDDKPCIAVHCVAGLGRAPVLVAIALIESGFEPLEAVEFIRKSRRGAINNKQLNYLEAYERRGSGTGCNCTIM